MNKGGRYVIAVLACAVIFVLYIALCVAAGFKRGGGILIMMLFFGLIKGVWSAITKSESDEDSTEKILSESTVSSAEVDEQKQPEQTAIIAQPVVVETEVENKEEEPDKEGNDDQDTSDTPVHEKDSIVPESQPIEKNPSSKPSSPIAELIGKTFPNGKESISEAVDELMRTGSFSSRGVVEKLYIYESVLFEVSSDKSKQRIVAGALRRPDNAATEKEAILVYEYLMKRYVAKHYGNVNEQLYTQLNESFGNTEVVCQDDVISGAFGRYGWDVTNPIPVRGIPAEPIYLNRLRTKDGRVIKWHRLGSTGAKNIKNPIDIYILSDEGGNDVGTIYVSPYQNVISNTAPEGLSLE